MPRQSTLLPNDPILSNGHNAMNGLRHPENVDKTQVRASVSQGLLDRLTGTKSLTKVRP